MSKCCGSTCACKLNAGDDLSGNDSIIITGTGTQQDPFVVSFRGLEVQDTTDLDLTLEYAVSDGGGYLLRADFASTSALDHLGDVNAPAPTNGQVLSFNTGTGKWVAANPVVAAPGAVNADTSLTGDGSAGNPLGVSFDPDGDLEDAGSGVKLTDSAINELVRHYTDATARDAASPAPELNSLSMLDDAPGELDYWDGANWTPAVHITSVEGVDGGTGATEFLALSGPYDGRPVQIKVVQINSITDAFGAFVILDSTDLTGYAGVLSAHLQPVGDISSAGWMGMVISQTLDDVTGTALAADGSGPLVSTIITAVATVYLY